MKNILKEFKAFAIRGNVIDMAVGIIIGASFSKIVDSLVKDVIMPPIGLLLGNFDFTNLFIVMKNPNPDLSYNTLDAAQKAGAVTLNLGIFINAVISFTIVAFAVFLLIKAISKLQAQAKKEEAAAIKKTTKTCPHCLSEVKLEATRCAFCTSELKVEKKETKKVNPKKAPAKK